MIDAVPFAACYVYSPSGTGAVSRRSRLLCALIKQGDAAFLRRCARRVRREAAANPRLADFFGPATVLVPVPGCRAGAPCMPSTADLLALALLNEGLAGMRWSGLRRVSAVRKSATALKGSRPTVLSHYESFAMDTRVADPARVVLVDDVVTKGRTLFAAAVRAHEVFPTSRIRAFALLRTVGFAMGVSHLLEPCVGEITWRRGDVQRNP